jgi:hypothetical protein
LPRLTTNKNEAAVSSRLVSAPFKISGHRPHYGERNRINTVGFAGLIVTVADVLDALPGTSAQLFEIPTLILFVCNCNTQP